MAFLFKSSKKANGLPAGISPGASRKLSSRDGASNSASPSFQIEDDRSKVSSQSSPQGGRVAGSPTSVDMAKRMPRTGLMPQRLGAVDGSLYPWSAHSLQFIANSNPFPRYGAALNASASKEGDVYMMGGLVEGATVKGDLWIVEAGTVPMTCYPVPTTAEGPGPRVGHASLLVGNAFIVFGGDTKVDEHDILDDTLYLLNTSTKHWSRALPAGLRPSGRYGHTLNILGSKVYVFGGQVEGYFFNDLAAFDLNSLQTASSHWEMLIQNTNDGGPPVGQIPPARTNHSIITYNEKLYLFGGTDGFSWFNDVWTYDPRTNSWAQQECIGFIPAAREGHAAALVGDVMYVFGGRTHEGKDLGDVAGFRIPTCRWYTFQNMGPSPSPRSGHGMTAFGNHIIILGGEPSSAPRNPAELSEAYVLDTSKIRYPDDKAIPKSASTGRPSVSERSGNSQDIARERSISREEGFVNGAALKTRTSQDSMMSGAQYPRNGEVFPSQGGFMTNGLPQKPTRSAPSPAPTGPPPQPRTNGMRGTMPPTQEGGRESPNMTQRLERAPGADLSGTREIPLSATRDPSLRNSPSNVTATTGDYSPSKMAAPFQNGSASPPTGFETIHQQNGSLSGSIPPMVQQQPPSAESNNRNLAESADQVTGLSGDEAVQSSFKQPYYADSGVGSSPALSQQNMPQPHPSQQVAGQQADSNARELEAMRSKNAWYASELALARKAGYVPTSSESPGSVSDDKTAEMVGDEEKPLLEALVRMRSELAKMQESLSAQGAAAATKIAQAEREKQAALSEAFYAKSKLASREESREIGATMSDRSDEASRRLASALSAQTVLSSQIQALSQDLESERRARQIAEDSADVAHTRATQLDTYKQSSTSELERLKSELYEAQRTARSVSTNHAEAQSSLELLQVDKKEMSEKLASAQEASRNHSTLLKSLHEAMNASSEKGKLLEQKLEREQNERAMLEEKLAKLRSEHESRVAELDSATMRLRDAEDLAESHANEARTHREAVLAGLGQERERDLDGPPATDERIPIFQERMDEAHSMLRRNQEAADHASERLRRAEERIAGLEAYQEQISREGLSLRKQLQTATKEALDLRSENSQLQQQISNHKLDSTALQVQHDGLRNLLNERGVDTSPASRGLASDSASSQQLAELQQQLDASMKSHDEMRQMFEQREQEANQGWEAKLQALDNDYQSAVRYLKGTEKMLGKLKQELHGYKSTNKDLEDELAREKSASREVASSNWESERASLRQELDTMQSRVKQSALELEKQMQQVQAANAERDSCREASMRHQRELAAATEKDRAGLETLRSQNSQLEARATEAERKVQMLLDTVGTSVSNYRRQSQLPQTSGSAGGSAAAAAAGPAAIAAATAAATHSRGLSVNSAGAESMASSPSAGGDAAAAGGPNNAASDGGFSRNSYALDSLANELETLRNQWQTASHSYRRSDQSDVATPTIASADQNGTQPTSTTSSSTGLADWRRRLELDDQDDDDDDDDEHDDEARVGTAMAGKA